MANTVPSHTEPSESLDDQRKGLLNDRHAGKPEWLHEQIEIVLLVKAFRSDQLHDHPSVGRVEAADSRMEKKAELIPLRPISHWVPPGVTRRQTWPVTMRQRPKKGC